MKYAYTIKNVKIFKADHLYESRTNDHFTRTLFVDDTRIKEVLGMALVNGLVSFTNKDTVAISWLDDKDRSHSMLVRLEETRDKCLYIISMYLDKKPENKYKLKFIKAKNRLNLWNCYTMKSMGVNEYKRSLKTNRENKIDIDCRSEDSLFKKYMNSFVK